MTAIKLLGPAWSRAFRCLWMLEELGVEYESVMAMPVSRRVKVYHKTGKVPVLLEFDDDTNEEPTFVLYESVAINTYLGDRYGNGELVPPASTRERAIYDQVTCCVLSELDAQGLWIHRKHESLGLYFGHIPAAVAAAEKQFHRINSDLASRLNPYLLGERFTAADIVYVHCLDWAISIGWEHPWPENLEEYRRRCHERPAFVRAKAMQDAEKREIIKEESRASSKL